MHKDFDLQVEFPINRLIPTLPLRLNYILWIEDIINTLGIKEASGIDIGRIPVNLITQIITKFPLPGCGASCIYPLLGAKKNNWSMTGIEIDPTSFQSALDNVSRNNLTDKVTVLHQPPGPHLLTHLLEGNSTSFTFCLCNPPFYDPESLAEPKNRTGHRPAPRNVRTGSEVELSCDGGEMNFIKNIFQASFKYKSRIRVFTTMVGIKNDMIGLVKELRRLGVTNYIETEFCQGRTTRWGLAWTFAEDDSTYLRTVPCTRSTFVKEPAIFFVPETNANQLKQKTIIVQEALLNILKELEIVYDHLPQPLINEKKWRLKCYRISWTNSRRKRREQQRNKMDIEGVEKDNNSSGEEDHSAGPIKRQKLDLGKPLLVADIYFNTVENGHTLQIFYLDGRQGKDACQQILQFIINRFNKQF